MVRKALGLTKKYAGASFIFYSQFEVTPGWKKGDRGVIVRLLVPPEVDDEIEDLWLARNERTGKTAQVWGGEAWTSKGPLIKEHRFMNWILPKGFIDALNEGRKAEGGN